MECAATPGAGHPRCQHGGLPCAAWRGRDRLIDPVQGVGRPVEHAREVERLELGRSRELLEQRRDHRHVQVVGGGLPIEGAAGVALVAKHPGREDAIKERLHQRRTKEVLAILGVEVDAERRLEALLQHGELLLRGGRGPLDTMCRLARVARQQPCQVFRFPQGRGMAQDAGKEIGECGAALCLCAVRMPGQRPESRPVSASNQSRRLVTRTRR